MGGGGGEGREEVGREGGGGRELEKGGVGMRLEDKIEGFGGRLR